MIRSNDIQPSLIFFPHASLTLKLSLASLTLIFPPSSLTLMLHLSEALEVSQSLALTTVVTFSGTLSLPRTTTTSLTTSTHSGRGGARSCDVLRQAPLGTWEGWGGGIWYQTTSTADHTHKLYTPPYLTIPTCTDTATLTEMYHTKRLPTTMTSRRAPPPFISS